MVLTIVTINRNNASGLESTIKSILSQTNTLFEHIIVDGASTDDSASVIKRFEGEYSGRLKWISEPDKGIYDAMNKGIRIASGQYIQFLNSGDCLASKEVVARIHDALEQNDYPPIMYGNMLKDMPDGKMLRDKCFAGQDPSLLGFYSGTLNHPSAYIRRDLFQEYGLYDEGLKIVADWKWFVQAIVLGGVRPVYIDTDVTLFNMTGISETQRGLEKEEREKVLNELIPPAILTDYNEWAGPIQRLKRLRRHPWALRTVFFIERCLFGLEKIKAGRQKKMDK